MDQRRYVLLGGATGTDLIGSLWLHATDHLALSVGDPSPAREGVPSQTPTTVPVRRSGYGTTKGGERRPNCSSTGSKGSAFGTAWREAVGRICFVNTLAEFAAQIGPQLDRLRLGVMRASVEAIMKSGLLAGSGQHLETFTVFTMLRNAYPDRVVPVRNFRAAYVYQDPVKFETALFRMTGEGLVEVGENESVALSAHGRRLMSQVRDVGAQAAEGLWGSGTLPVLQLADRCLVSAEATANADGAFRLVAPRHDEPDDSDATRLAERLTGLRWHRFDAHVAAWTAAGLTAESVADLSPGPERDEIEAQTNERAAQPYATLTSQERSALLDGLRGLA